jgi:hypothetical protein
VSAVSSRAARREGHAAAALGTRRVHRRVGESAPDVEAVRLPSGVVLGPEVKSRIALPKLLTGALDQARGYFPQAVPLAILYARGATDGVACVPLSAFVAMTGIDVATLPKATPLRRPKSPQLSLLDIR